MGETKKYVCQVKTFWVRNKYECSCWPYPEGNWIIIMNKKWFYFFETYWCFAKFLFHYCSTWCGKDARISFQKGITDLRSERGQSNADWIWVHWCFGEVLCSELGKVSVLRVCLWHLVFFVMDTDIDKLVSVQKNTDMWLCVIAWHWWKINLFVMCTVFRHQ